ncbi:MAG: hypothetical protein IPK34_02610 [Ramlibacter sp.]|jgi:hypothetical protein|nr:hypothetical protein [Ramlibacter sp.]
MGITLTAMHGLFAPLHDFLGWLASPAMPRRSPVSRPDAINFVAGQVQPAGAGGQFHVQNRAQHPSRPTRPVRAARPLRVLRVRDTGSRRCQAGRLVISGRMADVCAELDRLAAAEAALH